MKEKIKSFLGIIFIFLIIATIGMFWYDQASYYLYYSDDHDEIGCRDSDNLALIKIQGEIVAYDNWYGYQEGFSDDIVSSERIVAQINEVEKNEKIKAVIIEIDSYGGYPVAAEEIMNAIKRMKKPTIAVIREGAVSGAYLIASAADKIYASEMSDVGGIGITMSYLEYSQKNRQEGTTYQELSSAKFKDMGDPDKELTAEERELLVRDLNILHEVFVKKIAENRGLEIEEVERLADGSTVLGKAAKENRLINEIGDINDAKNWLREQFDIEPKICIINN